MLSIDEIKDYLKNNLSEKRFLHTLGVAKTAKSLAKRWGLDCDKAFLAGLVHDAAKEIPFDETIKLLEEAGITLTDLEKSIPGILHAPLGAVLTQRIFGIDDSEILDAVRYHTTGRVNMTLLEKIIYIADFIEPGRKYKESEMVREIAFSDLDSAALLESDFVIKFTIDRGKPLHPDTIHARNYLLKVTKEGK